MKVRAPSPDGSEILARHSSTSLRALVRPFPRSSARAASVGVFFVIHSLRHGRAFPDHPRHSIHVTKDVDARPKAGNDDYGSKSAPISRSSSAELSDLPWASSASDRVTPPPSAPVITKFSAAMLGSS